MLLPVISLYFGLSRLACIGLTVFWWETRATLCIHPLPLCHLDFWSGWTGFNKSWFIIGLSCWYGPFFSRIQLCHLLKSFCLLKVTLPFISDNLQSKYILRSRFWKLSLQYCSWSIPRFLPAMLPIYNGLLWDKREMLACLQSGTLQLYFK